jgi:double-strand break repair protein MRE11
MKKKSASRKAADIGLPDAGIIESLTLDAVKVDELVREFLTAQSLQVLPQNSFGDSVNQFVDKDDRHAVELFVNEALTGQVKHLLSKEDIERTDVTEAMEEYREERERLFTEGRERIWKKGRKFKPRPDGYDSEVDGPWEDQPGAIILDENAQDDDVSIAVAESPPLSATTSTRGRRGRRGGRGAAGTKATAKTTTAVGRKPGTGRGRKKVVSEDEEEDESDHNMKLDNDDESESQLFVSSKSRHAPAHATAGASSKAKATTATSRAAPATVTAKRQTKLDFSQPQPSSRPSRAAATPANRKAVIVIGSDDDIEDSDDDAFEDVPPVRSARGRR